MDISELVSSQREYFLTGATRSETFRKEQLKKLYDIISRYQDDIQMAVKKDFGKPPFESYLSEEGFVLSEIKYILPRLAGWMKPKRIPSNLLNFPSSARLISEPYGIVLIIGPWNYPFHLAVNPLIGAMAAGNCAIVKPSENAPETSRVTARLINDHFPQEYISVVEGGVETAKHLLKEKSDYVFFTGGQEAGRAIAKAAGHNLIPHTLELGGKSPCIVDESADLILAARRIAWGKCVNAGQTCVAPDYLYVHKDIRNELMENIARTWQTFYEDSETSEDYPQIINDHHFSRLTRLLKSGKIYFGGETNAEKRHISPTLLTDITWDDPVMQEEIFGPLLPVLSFENIREVIDLLKWKPKPLSLYLFSRKKDRIRKIMEELSFGAASVNDTIAHFGNPNIPFGGVGSSGYGSYHGKYSFDIFSHKKGILTKSNWLDIPLRYPPYKGKLNWLKTFFKYNFEW